MLADGTAPGRMTASLLTGSSPTRPPVNRSLPLSTRGHLQRARSRSREPAAARVRVLSGALRDHVCVVALAQNPANTGAFKAKPRELPRGAPVNCAPTFGWWWRKNGSPFGLLHQPSSLVGRKDSTRSQADSPGFSWVCVMAASTAQECYPTRQLHLPPPWRTRTKAEPRARLHASTCHVLIFSYTGAIGCSPSPRA